MEFLYHGSVTQDLKILEPRKRYTPADTIEHPAIYATPLPAFAAAHSFPWSSDEGFDIQIVGKKVELIVPAQHRIRLEIPISIYKISAENFEQTLEEETGQTWHTNSPAHVLEEQKYENVEAAISELGGTIRVI